MTLDEFTEMTKNVITEDGIAEYLPTLAFPDTKEVRVTQGIPEKVDHRDAIQNVIGRSGHEKREFLFGVRSAYDRVTIGHVRPGEPTVFMEIVETADGLSAAALPSCDWWRL